MISRRRRKNDANISLTRTVVRRYASIGDSTLITWYVLREIIKYLSHDNKENRRYSNKTFTWSTKFTFPGASPFLDRARLGICHDVIAHYDLISISSQWVALTVLRYYIIIKVVNYVIGDFRGQSDGRPPRCSQRDRV